MKPRYLIGGAIALMFVIVAALSLDNSKIEYTNLKYAQTSGKRVQVKGAWVKDIHNGAKPNNFELAESIVVKGRVENGVMQADHILTKCPSKYEGNGTQVKQSGT
jgi:cytochrome c-type biogenesis protein CcmE